jgi:diacylglycerol kinase (ATP)
VTADWTLIVNPRAGGGRARRAGDRAISLLAETGVRADVHHTRGPGHATDLAAAAVGRGAGRVVVCGGDGTVAEVLPPLLPSQTPLGVLAFGTANDLSRALGLPRRPAPAVRLLLDGEPRSIDTGLVNGKPFATVATFGYDAEVSRAMNVSRPPLPGRASYVVAALRGLVRYRPPRVRITGDFGQIEERVLLVAAANTSSYGGGMRIAPGARPDSGSLEICIVRYVGRPAVVTMLPTVFWGGHVQHPAVRMVRSTWMRLEVLEGGERVVYADGEHVGSSPVEVRVNPHSLELVTPPHAAARRRI